jgi:hypothetical protein
MGFDSSTWSCEICEQTVSRLLGMAGGVSLDGGGVQMRSVVRGYCADHREDVAAAFREELEAAGEVKWFGDPIVELRPRSARAWLVWIDETFIAPNMDGRGLVDSPDGTCPHCRREVRWSAGPHIEDAAARGGVAWDCGCGAAGVAYLRP